MWPGHNVAVTLAQVVWLRYNLRAVKQENLWWRSSVVEQGTHKPLVTSSNLVATTLNVRVRFWTWHYIGESLWRSSLNNMFPFPKQPNG